MKNKCERNEDFQSNKCKSASHTNTKTHRTNATCLWGCFGLSCSFLSFPIIFLLSLRFNPRTKQPFRNSAPTLPESPIPIWTRVSQLAARAWSKPADWCHKMDEGKGERKTRTETQKGRTGSVFLLSCFSGWQKTNERIGLNGPVNPQLDQGLDHV